MKAEPFKNQHDARTEAPGWLASLQDEQRIELEILDLEERLGWEKQRSDPRWAPFDAATLKQLAKAELELASDSQRIQKEIQMACFRILAISCLHRAEIRRGRQGQADCLVGK